MEAHFICSISIFIMFVVKKDQKLKFLLKRLTAVPERARAWGVVGGLHHKVLLIA